MFAAPRRLGMALAAGLALWATPLMAQDEGAADAPEVETRLGGPGFELPDASIYEMYWLEGLWQGTGIGGAPATENWLPPTGSTMVGTFIQQTAEGGIQFSEHMYLMEEEGSLVLKLKHFNADLTGWEDKDGMVTFRLLELEPCAAYFNALTLRCEGDDELVVAVRMKSSKPEVQELKFRFQRAQRSEGVAYDCDGNTLEMNACMAQILDRAVEKKDRYLEAALARYADRPEVIGMIRASDHLAEAYREQECGAVFEDFREGTIRTIMSLSCSISMVDERTRTIWGNWLTYPDSTPPDLPLPGPTR